MRKYKVRENFYVHRNETVFEPGTVLDLSEAEAEKFAVQVELLEEDAKSEGTSDLSSASVEVKSQKSKVKSDLSGDEQVQG